MKNKELKQVIAAITTAALVGGTAVLISPTQLVMAAETPAAVTQATTSKMSMAQAYAGLDIKMDPEYIAMNKEVYGTAANHFISNKIGWNLAEVNAVTLEGKNVKYRYLHPDILDAWGQQDKYISHSGGDVPVGQPAWYSLQVWPEGTTVENGLPTDLNQEALQVILDIDKDSQTGYADLADEGTYIRIVHSIAFGDQVGYYCIVEDKATKQLTSFQYTERADLYDDSRALTVIYSCLPQ